MHALRAYARNNGYTGCHFQIWIMSLDAKANLNYILKIVEKVKIYLTNAKYVTCYTLSICSDF